MSKISGKIVESLEIDHKERLEEGRERKSYKDDDVGPVTLSNETNNCMLLFILT